MVDLKTCIENNFDNYNEELFKELDKYVTNQDDKINLKLRLNSLRDKTICNMLNNLSIKGYFIEWTNKHGDIYTMLSETPLIFPDPNQYNVQLSPLVKLYCENVC